MFCFTFNLSIIKINRYIFFYREIVSCSIWLNTIIFYTSRWNKRSYCSITFYNNIFYLFLLVQITQS